MGSWHRRVGRAGVVEAAHVIGMVLGSGLVATLAARLNLCHRAAGGAVLGGACHDARAGRDRNLMQADVSAENRGRVGAALNTVITLASLVSMMLGGVLGDPLGVRQVF